MAMGIGTGITLIVLGLVLLMHVIQVDIPWVDEYTLGLLLALAGVTCVLLSATLLNPRRRRVTRVVEERRIDDPNVM
jgi:hypothetical protein